MRPAPSSYRLIAAAAFALALAGCNDTVTTDGGSTGGMDSGPVDAGPNCYCAALTESCSATQACCGNLACTGGKCAQNAAPACISLNNLCTTSAECCGSTDPGIPNYPNFTYCAPDGLGVSHCTIGVQGQSCSATKGCAYPLSCSSGTCKYITTGNICTGGNSCQPGDGCDFTASDTCRGSGLVCAYPYGLCLFAEVVAPGSNLAEANICSPGQTCVGRPGSSAATTCGTYWLLGQQPTSYRACMEACQTGDDCSSIAWDCVTTSGVKQCQSNFCYAADIPQEPNPPYSVANAMTAAQTMPVSNQAKVLFKACGAGAGPDTYCLPRYDPDWITTVGVCTRVGGTGAGGIGAACQPNASPTDVPGLCAAGSLCYRGTCHKWCDIDNPVRAGCDSDQACIAAGPPFLAGNSTDSTGICANVCDPYQPATGNTCPSSPTWTCDNPPMICKPNLPASADSDQYPQPGVCVGGPVTPIEVGMPCSTGIWVDPCVSGSFCALTPGGGNNRTCAQVCDVVPSPYMSEPACDADAGFTCVSVDQSLCQNPGRDGGWCKAFGTCQLN